MRARVTAQGVTIGIFFYYTGLLSPKKWAEDKRQREERRKLREGEVANRVETIK